jgi:hypothetical protein
VSEMTKIEIISEVADHQTLEAPCLANTIYRRVALRYSFHRFLSPGNVHKKRQNKTLTVLILSLVSLLFQPPRVPPSQL